VADTARDRLDRILQILPLASRDGGISYDDLAATLGVTRRQLERDLAEITDREFYHPPGSGSDIQVGLDAERVRVWTTGHLRRPTRLVPGEAAALDLGVRILGAERGDTDLPGALRRLVESLAWDCADGLTQHVAADGDPGAGDAIRALMIDAARNRRPVSFRYMKPDAPEPEERTVEPYTVVYTEGRWYIMGRSPERDAVRAFRADRVLDAAVDPAATFEPPADFDPERFITAGRVYRAEEEIEVAVRYAPRIAPWFLERGEGERADDGSVTVRHRVADPGWIVRHVLQYGPEATVLEPAHIQELVAEAARRVLTPAD
jgi:proteasome accessory factor C